MSADMPRPPSLTSPALPSESSGRSRSASGSNSASISIKSQSSSPTQAFSTAPHPTSPQLDKCQQAGSSRTRYFGPQGPRPLTPSSPRRSRSGTMEPPKTPRQYAVSLGEVTELPRSSDDTKKVEDVDAPHAPYRPPEAVVEPPEDPAPSYVIAEHPPSDDEMPSMFVSPPRYAEKDPAASSSFDISSWQQNQSAYNDPDSMDVDDLLAGPDKPRIGPGILPRRLLQVIHDHPLYQPSISSLPQHNPRRSHASSTSISEKPALQPSSTDVPSSSTASLPIGQQTAAEYDKVATMADVWNACPGGRDAHEEWFFCPLCWGWLRVIVGSGDPNFPMQEEWALMVDDPTEIKRTQRMGEWSRYQDIKVHRSTIDQPHQLFHSFTKLMLPTRTSRIERIEVSDEMNAFPHLTMEGLDEIDSWTKHKVPHRPAELYVDSGSDTWVFVDEGIVPGQLPISLVSQFTSEKMSNPGPGQDRIECVSEAWNLVLTLLVNPLFKKQRGWVQLENPRFLSKIGVSLVSFILIHQIGFGCREEKDVRRVGPFLPGDKISVEDSEKMDQYMLRAWVEISIYLACFEARNDYQPPAERSVSVIKLDDVLGPKLNLSQNPTLIGPIPDIYRDDLYRLGVTKSDVLATIALAYDLQIAADPINTKDYLEALERLSNVHIVGKENLQMKVAMERSLGRYTRGDLTRAYRLVGYDEAHAELIGVDGPDAPREYILDMHKKAVQATTNAAARSDLAEALSLIGRDRGDSLMLRLARSGDTFLSLDEAYAALSAPRDSIDDGLIMQYEMAVAEYPGKTEHYQMCLGIIADAPGEERPGLRQYLDTGDREPEAPPRRDIPVGLHNIGNTCYLNSILQYLYSIKPLREAVMSFEQSSSGSKTPFKAEIERSRRFVRQLRLLFLQLYKSERSSVRPDEELAYLAITRPEVDKIVEPEATVAPFTIDSIPDVTSPTSTRVNTPEVSPTIPNTSLPGSPLFDTERASSILGKRASTDRDDSSRSSTEHTRQKSEGFDNDSDAQLFDRHDLAPSESGDFDVGHSAESPSAITDLGALKLKSPEVEDPLEATVPPPLPPRPVAARRDTLASGLRFGLQQDSAEVLINVLSQLEMAFDPASAEEDGNGKNLISELFSCKYHQQTFYATSSGTVEAQTPVESVFVHPIIGVEEEGKDLYDCLGELYLKGDEIEYEGKKGFMMDLMDTFPPMLYIQMRRSQYDLKTGRETKTNTHIAFDQVLKMDRFLASADKAKRDQSIEITREMTRVRARLHQLRNNKPLPILTTLIHTRDALQVLSEDDTLGITPDFLSALEQEATEVQREIMQLDESLPALKRKLDAIWEADHAFEYELVSVFMHRGKTSGAGHYWTYQAHLPNHPDEFFKYNDETVTAVPASEVLEDRTGSDANPALLCYVRRDRHLVDTLHREILELNLLGEEEEEEIEVEEKEKAEKVDETLIAPTVEKEAMTVD